MIEVHTDGLCEPSNPNGVATYGVIIEVVIGKDDRTEIYSAHGVIGEGEGMTSVVAEYAGVADALRILVGRSLTDREIIFYTDNQVVAKQLNGEWGTNQGAYLPYYFEAAKLKFNFKNLKFQWIPREENEKADRLSREAYERYMNAKDRTAKYHRRRR